MFLLRIFRALMNVGNGPGMKESRDRRESLLCQPPPGHPQAGLSPLDMGKSESHGAISPKPHQDLQAPGSPVQIQCGSCRNANPNNIPDSVGCAVVFISLTSSSSLRLFRKKRVSSFQMCFFFFSFLGHFLPHRDPLTLA